MGLFLEGPQMIGKSTILRQQLVKGAYRLGGFYVQRLLSADDHIMGYQLRSAAELVQETASYEWSDEGCFIKRQEGQMTCDLSVFAESGHRLLQQSLRADVEIILLDEFGGLELQVPAFYQQLKAILGSSKKIIGVYKSSANYRQQVERSRYPLAVETERRELEELMEGQRLAVTAESLNQTSHLVEQYLKV